MSYLLNYKQWRAVHEAAVFESAIYGGNAVLSPMSSSDEKLLAKFLEQGASYKQIIVDTLTNLKILFNVDTDTAANYILVGYLRSYFRKKGKYEKFANKDAKFEKAELDILNEIHSRIESNWSETEVVTELDSEITLNGGIDPKTKQPAEGKVLTKGAISNSAISGSQTQLSSTVDIAKYFNTFNLANHPTITGDKEGSQYNGISEATGGAIDLKDNYDQVMPNPNYIYLVALADYTPPTGETKAAYTPPFTVTTPGAQTVAEVKDAFEVLDVVPKQEKITEVLNFIDKINQVGTITKMEVIGGASTEAVSGATAAAWATKYKVDAATLPPDNVINGTGTVGKVTDPKASGNAWLATERGKRFAADLDRYSQLSEITPTFSAEIGSDAANSRFVKVVFEVKAKNKDQVVPGKWVLDTVGTLGGSNEIGGGYKMKIYFPDFS